MPYDRGPLRQITLGSPAGSSGITTLTGPDETAIPSDWLILQTKFNTWYTYRHVDWLANRTFAISHWNSGEKTSADKQAQVASSRPQEELEKAVGKHSQAGSLYSS